MPRPQKDYQVAPSPELLIGNPGALLVNVVDADGQLECAFDFAVFAARPAMAAEWALAFRYHYAVRQPANRANAYRHLKLWFAFLGEHNAEVVATRDIDTSVLNTFIVWLGTRPWSKGTRYSVWSIIKQHLAWLKRNRPDLVHPDLDIPFNPFPRKNAAARQREVLSRDEMERVLAAARKDIEAAWARFEEGRAMLARVNRAAIAAEPDLAKLDLDDIGVMLAVIDDRFGGVPPKVNDMLRKGAELWRLHFATIRHGGVGGIAGRLFALPDTIVAYMIAIGAQTYANAEALRLMRRDCLSKHLLLEGRVMVSWHKGRAGREQRRSFLRDKSFSVPVLVEQVLAMTERLVPHAPQVDQGALFLTGMIAASRAIGVIPCYMASKLTRRFVERHGLVGDDGKLLKLTLATLRASGLTLAHERLGHDILKTQALANHATPDTTQRYVDRPRVRKAQALAIGRLQARFVEVARGNVDNPRKSETLPDLRNATAAGFICRDPLAGIAEGQRRGQLCTAWLGCFTCPNAVIPLDEEVLVRLLATRAALADGRSAMAPERWRLLYAPKLEILERDILPRFPGAMLEAAARKPLPQLPPVE
ncbi:site-specific integrase [Novosphingobium percolationis]|jgi:integrase|uniref:site-specific integrase n=1 Tax=Novosphingobium percolationis TaxID=2871811 RepID=UPI001CD4B04D|nr:site-specific integrase [Novosphingobium percolationis]